MFVLRISLSASSPGRATFGPQKNFLGQQEEDDDDDGAVVGLLHVVLLPDTSAFQELLAWVASVLARLFSSPQLHAPVAVALLLVVLPLPLWMLLPMLRSPSSAPVLLAFPEAADTDDATQDLSLSLRNSMESNLDGGFDVGLARKLSRPPS